MDWIIDIKRHAKILYFSLLFIIVILCFYYAISNGGNKMEPNYNINETKTLKPELYDTSNDSSLSLISVPQDNAIGTNDINNAITLLLFHKGKIHYDKYFKTPLMTWRGVVSTYPL